jgi:hypothetical protein
LLKHGSETERGNKPNEWPKGLLCSAQIGIFLFELGKNPLTDCRKNAFFAAENMQKELFT